MSLPKTYSTGGRARGLPIDGTLDYSALASDDPVGQFPPLPVRTRLDRLSWCWELFNGDFADLAEYTGGNQANQSRPVFIEYGQSRFTVQTNPFRIVPTTIADILMMSPPEYTDPILNNNLNMALYDIIVSQGIYGAAVVMSTEDTTDPLHVIEPQWWVPSETGWWYIDPEVNDEGNYTTCLVHSWVSGYMTVARHYFGGTFWSDIGNELEVIDSYAMPDNPLRVIPRLPRRRGYHGYRWGTSILEDIASPVAEINRRYSDASYVLSRQSRPTMTYRIADADREDISPDTDATTPFDEAVDELAGSLSEYDEHDHLVLPDAVQGVEAVTWDGLPDTAVGLVEHMQQAIETASSIPGLFSGLMLEGASSGIALKRLMLRLYAATLQTQKATSAAVDELLQMSGIEPAEWPNALEIVEDATDDPEDDEGMTQ